MATYVMLMKFVTPGVDSIKGAHAGRLAGKRAAKAMGITWKQQYLVMGSAYDIITVVDAPDDETMARFALMGLTGSLEIQTIRAFTESEADKLIEDLAEELGQDPGAE
ncbi:MAG: GYD domain-containing protein [Acidimicrobiales bacterium]